MGSMKDLYTRGVTDLESYNIGYQDAEDRIIRIANDWIDEANGHDGECACKHDAIVLEKFVSYLQA